MIKLTKIDEKIILIDENFIESVFTNGDTIITLHNGKSFAVEETLDEVYDIILQYKKECSK